MEGKECLCLPSALCSLRSFFGKLQSLFFGYKERTFFREVAMGLPPQLHFVGESEEAFRLTLRAGLTRRLLLPESQDWYGCCRSLLQ